MLWVERRCEIEINYGVHVEDKNGRSLGAVSNIVRDSWSGEISKIGVIKEGSDTLLFYSPEDVIEVTDTYVKLKVVFGEVNTAVQYGAKVFDKNNQLIGTVDYPVNDSLTGEVKKFRVKTESITEGLLFSIDDVEKVSPDEVKLKIILNQPVKP